MNATNRQSILIVEQKFREGIFNFLLSARYEEVAAVASPTTALDKARQSANDIAVADAGKPPTADCNSVDLAGISPGARIQVLLI